MSLTEKKYKTKIFSKETNVKLQKILTFNQSRFTEFCTNNLCLFKNEKNDASDQSMAYTQTNMTKFISKDWLFKDAVSVNDKIIC